ncbi:MAG: CaiB/BaiF CoA-transferase family protein [Pseudomonadota bacterium]
MERALERVKVLDLTMQLPGPYMTWLMAGLGAEIIKVENPEGGDYARAIRSGADDPPLGFNAINRNKKSLALNLKSGEGRELFLRLLDEYDVVVEGFRPGVMSSLGLDYENLRARQPRVIMVSISGYGQDGPYRLRAGHDLNYLSQAGIIGMTGTRDGRPGIPGVQIADVAGGSLTALVGLLAALYQRGQTGKGQYLDAAMFDGSFSMAVMLFGMVASGLTKPSIGGMFLNGGLPCYGLYQTKDGRYMSLGALEFKFWNNFCQALGREDLLDKQFGPPDYREEVDRIFSQKTQAEWVEFMQEVDACCEAVLTFEEAVDSSQVQARGLVTTWPDGSRYLASPLKLSASPIKPDEPAPELGQHNKEILSSLGLTEEDVNGLAQRGVI